MQEICRKESCSGCAACFNACPKGAIRMEPDVCGFVHPQICQSLCIDCGVCQVVCPVLCRPSVYHPTQAFAAHCVDHGDRMSSTSGGVASVLAAHVLSRGGCVYGCSGEQATRVRHVRITQSEELARLKGSKYVQSEIGDIFGCVKADLNGGRQVLFVGTPCQVSGLRGFLRKEYDNLTTADLVCHGVPSQQLLNDALLLHADRERLDSARVLFREKGREERFGLFVTGSDGRTICSKAMPREPYITGFMHSLFYRESCYGCVYATAARVSDLTLGDFWGLERATNTQIDRSHGVSMVLTNTAKGVALFNESCGALAVELRSVDEAIAGNDQLRAPSHRHKFRPRFLDMYPREGFVRSCNVCLRDDRRRLLKERIYRVLSHVPYLKRTVRALRSWVGGA